MREVVRQTGLGAHVLRIWEARYGWPCPGRCANGYCAYPVSMIPVLRAVREQLDRGRTIGDLMRDPSWGKIMEDGRLPVAASVAKPDPPDWSTIPLPQGEEACELRAKLEAALEQGDAGKVALIEAQGERLHPRERGPAITSVVALWQLHAHQNDNRGGAIRTAMPI